MSASLRHYRVNGRDRNRFLSRGFDGGYKMTSG
jgi:hypothetical protein